MNGRTSQRSSISRATGDGSHHNTNQLLRHRSKSAVEPLIWRAPSRSSRPGTRASGRDPPKMCRRCRTASYGTRSGSGSSRTVTGQSNIALPKEDLKRLANQVWGNWRGHMKIFRENERLSHKEVGQSLLKTKFHYTWHIVDLKQLTWLRGLMFIIMIGLLKISYGNATMHNYG